MTEPKLQTSTYDRFMLTPPGTTPDYVKSIADYARYDRAVLWPKCLDRGITPTAIRQLNPKCKVYVYYSLAFTHTTEHPMSIEDIDAQDLWLRGGDGKIVSGQGLRWVKPVNAEIYARLVLDMLKASKADGVVLDGWYPDLYQDPQWFPGENPTFFAEHGRSLAYPTNEDWWHEWYWFIHGVTGIIRGENYKVIGNCVGEFDNCSVDQKLQRLSVDGCIYEQLLLGWAGGWRPVDEVRRRFAALQADPLWDVWAVEYGLRTGIPDYQQKRKASLAAYYLSLPNAITRRAKRSYGYWGNGTVQSWDSDWDLDIGAPVEKCVEFSQPNGIITWHRRFTKADIELIYYPKFTTPQYIGEIEITA